MTTAQGLVRDLAIWGHPLFVAPAGRNGKEFIRPSGWQHTNPIHANATIDAHRDGDALCVVLGNPFAVIDVDIKAGADTEHTRRSVTEAGITIYAEVATPSGGRHFYVAGHPDVPSIHHRPGRDALQGLPGVEILSHGTNAFLPGTRRPKYQGKGYEVVFDRLNELDPAQGERVAQWVADHRPQPQPATNPAPQWTGCAPTDREQKYLGAMLARMHSDLSAMGRDSGRNTAVFNAGLAAGNFIAGAGLDRSEVESCLLDAARANGLAAEDGDNAVLASIRSGIDKGMRTPKQVPDARQDSGPRHEPPPPPNDEPPADDEPPPPEDDGKANPLHTEDGPPPIDEAAFWESRPLLAHVREAALSRIVSPWSVLGCVLLRALGGIPPDVTLPPLVGAKGSLNSMVALVGSSASGKSSADHCARELAVWPRTNRTNRVSTDDYLHTVAIGTGEGIPKQYMQQITEKDPADSKKKIARWELIRDSAMFTADEVGALLAIGQRAGATLVPKLCSAWSGSELGQANADIERRVPLGDHAYRFVMWIGAQPLRCEGLFEYESMGLPQRIVWLPAVATDLPDVFPDWPEPIILDEVRWEWHHTITVPAELRDTVRTAARDRLEGKTGALDGHSLFAREKIAVALAVLDGRRDVSVEDWDLSGVVMAVSDRTRTAVQAQLVASRREKTIAKAKAAGIAEVVQEDTATEHRTGRVARIVLRHVARAGSEGIARGELRKKIKYQDRRYVDAALAELENRGDVEVRIAGCTRTGGERVSGERVFSAGREASAA